MTRLNNHRPKPLGLILFFVFKIRSDNFLQSNLPAQFFTLHCLQSFYLRIPFAFIQKRLVRNSKLLIPWIVERFEFIPIRRSKTNSYDMTFPVTLFVPIKSSILGLNQIWRVWLLPLTREPIGWMRAKVTILKLVTGIRSRLFWKP